MDIPVPHQRRFRTRVARTRAWWRLRGRRGILVGAAGLFVVIAGLANAATDQSLVHTLRSRGITTSGVVTGITYGRHGLLNTVTVQFAAVGHDVRADLSIIDTVPADINKNQSVDVIYDPQHPSDVLLTRQLNSHHITADYAVAAFGGAVAVVGFLWWLFRRRAPRG